MTPRHNFRRCLLMLKILLSLLAGLPLLETDLVSLVNEVKDAPSGLSALTNGISALRKLADDIESIIS